MQNDSLFLATKNTKQIQELSIADVVEILARKSIYKSEFKAKPETSEEYRQFKNHVKRLRDSKLPFRMIDIQKQSLTREPKEVRKEKLTALEQNLLEKSARLENNLAIAEKTLWLHGTNSSIFALLPQTNYQMTPTGRLLDQGLAPMGGEIKLGGTTRVGTNQIGLSTDTIRNFRRCWGYADTVSKSFDSQAYEHPEQIFSQALGALKNSSPDNDDWDYQIITLTRLKLWNPEMFQQLVQLHSDEIQAIKAGIIAKASFREVTVQRAFEFDVEKWKQAGSSPAIREEIVDSFPKMLFQSGGYHPIGSWDEKPNIWGMYDVIFTVDDGIPPTRLKSFDVWWRKLFMNVMNARAYGDEIVDLIMAPLTDEDYTESRARSQLIKFCGTEHPTKEIIISKLQETILPHLDKRIQYNMIPFERRFERFNLLFDAPPQVYFTANEKKLIETAFPVLLGSTKTKSYAYDSGQSEFRLTNAQFGKDIDLVFVKPENHKEMKSWLESHGLTDQVAVHDVAIFQELQNESFPLRHSETQIASLKTAISNGEHQELSLAITQHVVPLYKAAYPDGTQRRHHGVPHAIRVYFFAAALLELYHDKHIVLPSKQNHLLLTAALHDCAREGDGYDAWEKESAEKSYEILTQHFEASPEEAELLKVALIEKDNPEALSLEQKLVHDADCLEIIRIILHDPESFKPQQLWILKDLDEDDVYNLIAEAKLFIRLTEKEEIKSFLTEAEQPVEVLFQILDFAFKESGKFSMLKHLLRNADFSYPEKYKLFSEIEKTIILTLKGY